MDERFLYGGDEEAAVSDSHATATATPTEAVPRGEVVDVDLAYDPATAGFVIVPHEDAVSAGTVTFNVVNRDTTEHNLLVIRTDFPPDELPVDPASAVVAESAVDVVARVDAFVPGEPVPLTVELEPGPYVLICNVPTHYVLGMHAPLTVD